MGYPIVVALELRFGIDRSLKSLLRMDAFDGIRAGVMTGLLMIMCSLLIGSLLVGRSTGSIIIIQGLVAVLLSLWR